MSKILVIDDDDILRDLMAHALTADGHEVVTAENGDAGIAAARREAPDLIVSDMNMPKMTGWQMIEKLQSDAMTSNIPIIALTAHKTADDRTAGYRAGVAAYEAKPVDMARLKSKIAKLLNT